MQVYIKTNPDHYVTAVDSGWHIPDLTDWVLIDEGNGDRYAHAQGNYFDEPLQTLGGCYPYKYDDGAVRECTAEELAAQIKPSVSAPTAEERIADLELMMLDLDYRQTLSENGIKEGDLS